MISPLALFVTLAILAAGFVLVWLTGLTALLAALLTTLPLLLAGLLAGALLVLVFLLLTFLARLLILVHWSSKDGVCPSLLIQPLPDGFVPAEPHGSKGFFVYFLRVAQIRGLPDFAAATFHKTIN